ncbi:MAG TPA: IclR family transcriptional regulator [Mycobacteriales bacterium]|nr:IclR family transcriptional regulator [Mycobacteriales bacterium]
MTTEQVAADGGSPSAASSDAPSDLPDDARPRSISTDRTLTVLETLVESETPLTLTSLAQVAGIPLATCAAIAQTLEQRGYASRQVVGRSHFWRPTLRLSALSARLLRAIDPSDVAKPHLEAVADQLGMPTHLGVLDGWTIVYVAKSAPPGFIQFDTYPGKISSFNLTALGKAIAAFLPDGELAPLLHHLATGTGPKARRREQSALQADLAEIRERGYAVEDQEELADIGCVAAPVFGADERVAYSVGVTGFSRELLDERFDEAVEAIRRAASRISRGLGSSIPSA